MQWQQQNIHQTPHSQKTPHISPFRASYGMSFMKILENIDCVITAPHWHCTFNILCFLQSAPRVMHTMVPVATDPTRRLPWGLQLKFFVTVLASSGSGTLGNLPRSTHPRNNGSLGSSPKGKSSFWGFQAIVPWALTHGGRNKMVTISLTTFSNAFPWIKTLEF